MPIERLWRMRNSFVEALISLFYSHNTHILERDIRRKTKQSQENQITLMSKLAEIIIILFVRKMVEIKKNYNKYAQKAALVVCVILMNCYYHIITHSTIIKK